MSETEVVQPTQEQQEVDALAAFAFQDNKQPSGYVLPTQTAQAAPIAPETGTATVTPSGELEETVDANAYIKEHFGLDSMDALREQWAELQKIKNTPATATELAFANEQSKKIFENIKAGNTKQVREYLEAQELLSNSDSMNEEQKLKLYIKMNNPMYDPELVDMRFSKDYGFNEAAFKDEDGNITDPMGYKLAKIDALQRLKNDTTKADEFFTQYKTKIDLSNIATTNASVDKDYEDYKASSAQYSQIHQQVIVPALTALKDSDVPFNVSVNDENNQIKFDLNVAVDPNDFEKARKYALDFNTFLQEKMYDPSGNFQAAKLQRLILLNDNFDKYAQTIARQAVNAERKRVIEKETGGPQAQRNYNTQSALSTEMQEYEKFAFQGVKN